MNHILINATHKEEIRVAIVRSQKLTDKEKMMMIDRIPLKRQGSPNDIAEAVLFLANAKYITGQVFNIDGGRSLNQ